MFQFQGLFQLSPSVCLSSHHLINSSTFTTTTTTPLLILPYLPPLHFHLLYTFLILRKQTKQKINEMKEEHQQLSQPHFPKKPTKPLPLLMIKLLRKPAAYVTLLLLAYVLGYLSAPSPPLADPTEPNQLDNFRVTTRCSDRVPPELVRETLLSKLFNGSSPFDDFPPPHALRVLQKKRIKGWGSNGAVFEHLIEKVKPKVIIEVGTFLGASALHMAALTRKLGLDTQILCIDDFRGWPGFRDRFKYVNLLNGDVWLLYQFMWNVASENQTGSVVPVPFSSGSALEKLCEWGVYGDLIEIDAGHDFNSAWADINRAVRVLRPGGVIFGHDYFTGADNRGVRRAVNLFAHINGHKVRTHGQHWVIHTS